MRDSWGRARYTPLMEEFKAKGIKPVADEEMSPDANDATAQVLRLKQTGADAKPRRRKLFEQGGEHGQES